jgi:hypothetical protein
MAIKNKIRVAFALVISVVLFMAIIYRPVLLRLDNRLVKKAERVRIGMTDQEVIELMGKPNCQQVIGLDRATAYGLPEKVIEGLRTSNSKVLMREYWIPMYLQFPLFMHAMPAKSIISIFIDGTGKVCYVVRSESIGGIGVESFNIGLHKDIS